MRKFACLCIVLFLFILLPVQAGAFQPYDGYTYDEWNEGIPSAVGYGATAVHYGDLDNQVRLESPRDMCMDEQGRFFVLGSWDKGVTIFNNDFSLVGQVKDFVNEDGTPYSLTDARSLVVTNDQLIIADYENMALVISDLNGNIIRLIEKPTNPTFPSDKEFRPYAVSVDSDGNIYVLILDIYQGAAVFTPQGDFKGFYGSNKVTPTLRVLADRFWKKLMNEEQRDQLADYVPQPIKNMDLTTDGFMYVCTETSGYGNSNLRCINPYGQDVWKGENSTGDLEYETQKGKTYSTEFVDVSVSSEGYLYALDSKMCRIFMYDPDHDLVFSFGGLGDQMGAFSQPVAIESYGDTVYVLDAVKASITVFNPTEYGQYVMAALNMHFDSRYDDAVALWEKVLQMNGNESDAYDGIGKALLYSGEYQEAMEYFRLAGNRAYESRTFELYRTQLLRKTFPQIMLGILILVALAITFSVVKKVLKKKKTLAVVASSNGVRYAKRSSWNEFFQALVHPVDTFEEIRYKQSGSVWIAGLFMVLLFVFTLMERHLLAFRFNAYTVENTNVLLIFVSTFLLVVLGVLSNWGVTTLWDGKANMRLIWIVFGYALAPFVVSILLRTVLSGFLTIEEGVFTGILTGACLLWSALILWFGLLQTQEFTIKKNFLAILCTIVGMALLLLLGFLVILLFQELFVFVAEFFEELLQRLG